MTEGALGDGFEAPPQVAEALRSAWTAQQLLELRPQTAKHALDLVAGGMPKYRVAQLLGLSVKSIHALMTHELTLTQQRQRIGNLQLMAGELAAEAVVEDMSDPETRAKIQTVHKAMISRMMTQAAQDNLSGGVSMSVSVSVPMSPEQYRAAMESMGSSAGIPATDGRPEAAPTTGETTGPAAAQVLDLPPDAVRVES